LRVVEEVATVGVIERSFVANGQFAALGLELDSDPLHLQVFGALELTSNPRLLASRVVQ